MFTRCVGGAEVGVLKAGLTKCPRKPGCIKSVLYTLKVWRCVKRLGRLPIIQLGTDNDVSVYVMRAAYTDPK